MQLLKRRGVHAGRYDELKSAAEQIDFRGTILSRFDLIFIVRDRKDEGRDRVGQSRRWRGEACTVWLKTRAHVQEIASHVISIHKNIAIEQVRAYCIC